MFLSACLLAALPAAPVGHTVAAVAPADGGKLLFVAMRGGGPGWVCVWDMSKPELKAVIPGVPADVRAIQPTADGKRFMLVAGDYWRVTALEVWDTEAKKRLHNFDVSARAQATAAVSPDGNWVAYRPLAEKAEVRVWNTATGWRAEEVEKAASGAAGTVAFGDPRRLAVATAEEYLAFDLATGRKAVGWKPAEVAFPGYHERLGWTAALPDGRGVVTVAATQKRRQSYVVRIVTQKKDWLAGEFWDYASAPVLSPDGRTLVVSGGRAPEEPKTFTLKLDADGAPEMEDKPEKFAGPWYPQLEKRVPAWREWALGEANRGGREAPTALAFSADGTRLFAGGPGSRLHVHDAERRALTATLFAAQPRKDELPEWHILTTAGEFVGSPAEAEALAKSGKAKDAAKVKAALGVK